MICVCQKSNRPISPFYAAINLTLSRHIINIQISLSTRIITNSKANLKEQSRFVIVISPRRFYGFPSDSFSVTNERRKGSKMNRLSSRCNAYLLCNFRCSPRKTSSHARRLNIVGGTSGSIRATGEHRCAFQ